MRSRQGQWQRHATRLGVALSLLLHAAALLLYLAFAPPPVDPPAERPLIIELVGPINLAPLASAASTLSTGPGASALAPALPPPSLPSPRPLPSLPPELSTQPTPEVASATPRSLFEANGLGAAPAPRSNGTADLAVRSMPSPSGGGGAGAGAGDAAGPGASAAGGIPTGAASRVGTLLRQASGRARVRTGHDPAWSPLSERLRSHFQPDWSLLETGPQPTGIASTGLARMLPGYLKMAERFARSERLSDADGVMGERTSEAGKVTDRMAAAGGQSSTGLGPPPERFENPFQRTWVTLVEVAHRDDGSVSDIRLRQPCGNGAIDRLALAATRHAVDESEPAAWAGKARTSVWAFTAIFNLVPPAPILACPTNVAWTGRFDHCAYPLKKLSAGQVELEAIE